MLWEVVNASDNRDEGSKAGMGKILKGVFLKREMNFRWTEQMESQPMESGMSYNFGVVS